MPLYAGHGVGAVTATHPAADIVHELTDGSRQLLARHAAHQDATV